MMIDFQNTNISDLIKDYLNQNKSLDTLYHRFPKQEKYAQQAKEKLEHYSNRSVLNRVLNRQMQSLSLSEKQKKNLQKLAQNNCLTVTTGHQLNLMTGPLYFIYKILHTVKICDALNQEDSEYLYVPIYWMATEDHDFEEINHFNSYQRKYEYDAEKGNYVGEISTENTWDVLNEFMDNLPDNPFSNQLKFIIKKAYFQGKNLAEATRTLVHELLGEYGILILDANDKNLKNLMIPFFENELKDQPTQKQVEQSNQILKHYKNQAYAREINLFFQFEGKRERIELNNGHYVLTESRKTFTETELLNVLHQSPENFSPNVILRPLYQEVILPNVSYVGGGGEIAYWLQLKSIFDMHQIPFPMLVVRNSVLLLPNAMKHKVLAMDLYSERMFQPLDQIKKDAVKQHNDLFNQLQSLKQNIEHNFESLAELAKISGDDFGKMVQAQKFKQIKGYENLEKRLVKSEKKRHNTKTRKLDEVYDYIFPKGNWQERVINFSTFYQQSGQDLFDEIYDALHPFNSAFHIITLNAILK